MKWFDFKWFRFGFILNNPGFDKHLFQLFTLLKPDLNCWSSLELSCVDKVTTGTYNFVSVILNIPAPVELVIIQVDDHYKIKLTLQFIKGISRVLQKLLKFFNGTII